MLLLDEPFGALDAFTREELWCILRDLWTEQRFNVILVTHDLRESVFLADTVYVMSKSPGRFVVKREIDLPRPRDLEVTYTKDFADLVHELREHIGAIRSTAIASAAAAAALDQADARWRRMADLQPQTSRTLVALGVAGRRDRAVADRVLGLCDLRLHLPEPAVDLEQLLGIQGRHRGACVAHLLGHDGGLRPRDSGRRGARLRRRQLAPGLRRDVPADDRVQRIAQSRVRADPGGLVRHRHRPRDPDRVPDQLLPDHGQHRDRPGHARARTRRRAAACSAPGAGTC